MDWDRVHRRESADATHTFEQLKTELIRHHEFHAPLHQHAVNYSRRKGRIQLRARIVDHLRTAIGAALPYHDGWQTPYPDADNSAGMDVIFAAQHATASCCRKCAETWHGIPQGRDLNESELHYLADLAMRFVDERLPDLAEEPVKVPVIRRREIRSERNGAQRRATGTQ